MTAPAIFITGAASGIGRATARLFAARGWRVGLADLDEAGMLATAAMLPERAATIHLLDVRDRSGWVDALTAFTIASGGRLDLLFNNAGIPLAGPFARTAPERIDAAVAINLTGVLNGAHCGYPFLKATPGACLLNMASAAALYGTPGGAVYSATKFAVRGLSEALDIEWAGDDIRVRALMPSFVETPLLDRAGEDGPTVRARVAAAGLEVMPVEAVAQAAWDAVHGDRLHTLVGRSARRLARAARWVPGVLRRRLRTL